ncbi:hypothetical protein B4U84_05700 [Westiellopsis prolifica IICB1]|nr:hypothetical protein B4U84_05700 [Westiellopsis prolifica IICB1]
MIFNLLQKLKKGLQNIDVIVNELQYIKKDVAKIQEGLGRVEYRQLQLLNTQSLPSNEFRVFSQWGEDGIIQYLLRHIQIPRKVFVEFGVQNYLESNTRFLLVNNNWSGLLIEANPDDVNYIKQDNIYWQHNLKVAQEFINKDNINKIFIENGIKGEIGLLSIDIDGNDYWIWKEIDVIQPAIVIVEYNFRFGKDRAITIPYDDNFIRSQAHHSMIYFGASLKSLYLLGKQKGYAFVGCNSAGNDAFFVRQDLKPDCVKELTVEEGYIAAKFRESRNKSGELIFLSHEEEEKLLEALPFVDVE